MPGARSLAIFELRYKLTLFIILLCAQMELRVPLRFSELLLATASALLAGPAPFWPWCSPATAVDTEATDFLGVSFELELDVVDAEDEVFPADPPVGAEAGPDLEGVEPDPEELDVPGPPPPPPFLSLSLSLSFFPPFPPPSVGFFSFLGLGLNSVMTTVTSFTVTLWYVAELRSTFFSFARLTGVFSFFCLTAGSLPSDPAAAAAFFFPADFGVPLAFFADGGGVASSSPSASPPRSPSPSAPAA